jgi:hypothetical protein
MSSNVDGLSACLMNFDLEFYNQLPRNGLQQLTPMVIRHIIHQPLFVGFKDGKFCDRATMVGACRWQMAPLTVLTLNQSNPSPKTLTNTKS